MPTIEDIMYSISISHKNDDGVYVPVKMGELLEVAPLQEKIITRLYTEGISQGGTPTIRVVGVISYPLRNYEVSDMLIAGEYHSQDYGRVQIWINETEFLNIRVIIPTHNAPVEEQIEGLITKQKRDRRYI